MSAASAESSASRGSSGSPRPRRASLLMLWIESRRCSTTAGSYNIIRSNPLRMSRTRRTRKLTASFFAATPATSFFVSRGTRESVSKNRNDLKLQYRYPVHVSTFPGYQSTLFNSPLYSFHTALPSKPWSGIRKCSAINSNRVVHAARISM